MPSDSIDDVQSHPGVARLPPAVRAVYLALLERADRFGVVLEGRAVAVEVLAGFGAASSLPVVLERLEGIRALTRVPYDVPDEEGWRTAAEWVVYTPATRAATDRAGEVFE